jgi:hypothetical protein
MGSFIHRAFKALREEKAAGLGVENSSTREAEEEAVTR